MYQFFTALCLTQFILTHPNCFWVEFLRGILKMRTRRWGMFLFHIPQSLNYGRITSLLYLLLLSIVFIQSLQSVSFLLFLPLSSSLNYFHCLVFNFNNKKKHTCTLPAGPCFTMPTDGGLTPWNWEVPPDTSINNRKCMWCTESPQRQPAPSFHFVLPIDSLMHSVGGGAIGMFFWLPESTISTCNWRV